MNKKILSFFCMAVFLLSLSTMNAFAAVLEDGAYTVSRQTSYVNPKTGNTADGGKNIALGDSMCASIVEDHLLVEQVNGKTYITIGIGLMSNIENVRVQIEDQNGIYHDAKLTMTGSCLRNGDTCNHYRFEAYSADGCISPIIYVTPMGRDVQFFVIPDTDSAQSGTGNFVSEMIQKAPDTAVYTDTSQFDVVQSDISQLFEPENEPSDIAEPVNNEQTSSVAVTDEAETEISKTSDDETEANNSNILEWVVVGIVILAVAGMCVWYFCFFKKKQK